MAAVSIASHVDAVMPISSKLSTAPQSRLQLPALLGGIVEGPHDAAVKYAVRAAGTSAAVAASPEEGTVVHVGSGQPIKAFQVALKTMKQGEKASLKIKPACKTLHLLTFPLWSRSSLPCSTNRNDAFVSI